MARRRREKQESQGYGFLVLRSALTLVMLWGSLWASGAVGSRVGAWVYDDRYAPPPPYSDEQILSMERVSPGAAEVARRDLEIWSESVEMGRSVARVEGALAGTMLLLACWGTFAFVWLWSRERERQHRRLLDWDDAEGV